MMATLLITLTLTGGAVSESQTPHIEALNDRASSPATIEDVAWITGAWEGAAIGGEVEEVWSRPRAGTMMGMFRASRENAVRFYELLAIAEEAGSLILRIKHFNPDLSSWEAQDESMVFPLVRVDDRHAYFDGLTFEREGTDALNVYVRHDEKDGSQRELVFNYRRQAP